MTTAENDSCTRAIMASAEVVAEECSGEEMKIKNINGNALALVPQDAKDEFGFDVNSPETESEREEAIENCMDSEWATGIAESLCGSTTGECAEQVMQNACEGLFD